MLRLGALFLLAPLSVLAALTLGPDPAGIEAARPLVHRDGGFAGAATCRACHADRFESWRRTFHSTMTQRPEKDAVLGAFDGARVEWLGTNARPFERDGRFFMELPAGEHGTRVAEVALAVGSRRYQQYFEREPRGAGEALVRLPLLWHVDERRWLHVNAAFLEPDSADWDLHRTTWNSNCILCHNTAPAPHALDATHESFWSATADLGIACESCHGPGAEHASRMRDPMARLNAHDAGHDSLAIVDPTALEPERSVAVCGQCHGQRLPQPIDRAATWITSGPTFRAGERLADHAHPIDVSTPVPGGADPELFRARFWGDGTPRLTAYELQGITASGCSTRGAITCLSCHSMHGGDVRGQMKDGMRGDRACTQCHEAIGRNVAAHTGHRTESAGSRCVECHMPRVVYGVLEVHRSHRIDSPDPVRDAAAGRPHACTLCHLDRDLAWSAREMSRMFAAPRPVPQAPSARLDRAPLDLPDSVASLLAGDAVARVVAAAALGRRAAPLDERTDAALRTLLVVTLGDAYPSVRFTARRTLLALERDAPLLSAEFAAGVEAFDVAAAPERRRAAVLALLDRAAAVSRARFAAPDAALPFAPDWSIDLSRLAALTDLQGQRVIAIGE